MVKRLERTNQINTQPTEPPKPVFGKKAQKKVSLSAQVTSIFRYLANSIHPSKLATLNHNRIGDPLKVVLFVKLPLSILSIINSIRGFKESSLNEKCEDVLNVISEVGNLADNVATATDGLAAIGLTTAKVVVWTSPLFIVGLTLQTAGLVLTTKSLVETHIFSKAFKKSVALKEKVETYALHHFASGVDLIVERSSKGKRFVSKHFGVKSDQLMARLNKIKIKAETLEKSGDQEKKLKIQSKMKRTVELLDRRMMVMKKSKALTIVATTISIIGIIVLLTTPAAPVGFVLLGIGSIIELTHYFKMRSMTKQFKADMKLV